MPIDYQGNVAILKPMVERFKVLIGLGLALILAFGNLTVLESNVQPAQAVTGAEFDPGLIISDTTFHDFGSMTVDDIQKFLNAQVPVCKDGDGGPKCLRNYTENVVGSVAIKSSLHSYSLQVCKEVPAAANQTSAQIIFSVAQACGINPKVLLVTLQKEQGLVQASNPTTYMYKAAMGYGCPDSNPAICGADSNAQSRLFWQLYRASWQLRWYGDPRGSFTYLKPGKTISVLYNPTTTCGKKAFLLKNQSTAKLYYYTPYTPNQAALNNLYGTGDSCSAYGNRNFWRWYWKWFGSPVSGGFIISGPAGDNYLVINSVKYRLVSNDLLGAYAPLGAGIVSQSYLDSIPTGANLTRLIKDAANQLYFVDRGLKYPVADCAQAATLGYTCEQAVALTQDQLNLLPSGAALTALVPENPANPAGAKYLIVAGTKREIMNDASVAAENLTLPALGPIGIDAFNYLPWGAPIATKNALFTNRTNGLTAIIFNDQVLQFDQKLVGETNFGQWFPSTTGSLSSGGLSAFGAATPVSPVVQDPQQRHYMLTNAGKTPVNNGAQITKSAPTLSEAFLNTIPTVNAVLETPGLVTPAGTSSIYLVKDAALRQVSPADVAAVSTTFAVSATVQTIPQSALSQLTVSGTLFKAGSVLRDPRNGLWLVDGSFNLVNVPTTSQAKLFGLAASQPVSDAQMVGYGRSGALSNLKLSCGAQNYIAVKGTLRPIAAGYAAHYPGAATALNADTCKTLKLSTKQVGRFVKSANNKIYLMQNGKRRLVRSTSQYKRLVGKTPGYYSIDLAAALKLPIGSSMSYSSRTAIKKAAN